MSSRKIKRLGIFGAGAFGTALALSYATECEVSLFTGFDEHVDAMKRDRKNEFLNQFEIPSNIMIDNISNISSYNFDYIFWCFPVKPSISILKTISVYIKSPMVICSKGLLEDGTFLFDAFQRELPNISIGYLSGPNFAMDLASHQMSCADIGFLKMSEAEVFASELSNASFKLFPTDDVIGMQIAGAVKNVIAIACGIAKGLDLGQDTIAALLTLGLHEMKNLGVKFGGSAKTFDSFSGIGDLFLTASSETSRNTSFGKKIASGESMSSILSSSNAVCEGCNTVSQIVAIAKEKGVKMPICEAVYAILFGASSPEFILNVFN